jgi:hypothetical protein
MKFRVEHTLKLREDWRGKIQINKPRLGGKKTPVGGSSPENGRNKYVGIEDGLHLSRLMENVIHESFAFFLRHPPEIYPPGPAHGFELFAILVDESVKTLQPHQKLSQRRFFSFRGELIQASKNLFIVYLDGRHG